MRTVTILLTMTIGGVLAAACQGMDDGDLTEPPDGTHCHAPTPDYCPAGDVCVDLSTNAENCGACDVQCATPPHASVTSCAEGACAVSECIADHGDCDGTFANGCETDLLTSNAHCGACGHACATTCNQGACSNGMP